MAWPPVYTDLYVHAAPSSFFDDMSTGDQQRIVDAATGELATKLRPRVGGPASAWTWTDSTGQEEATRDVCWVAAGAAVERGLVLPSNSPDERFVERAQATREKWARMGTPGVKDQSKAEPLYSGLVDASPDVSEGSPRGWSAEPVFEAGAEL